MVFLNMLSNKLWEFIKSTLSFKRQYKMLDRSVDGYRILFVFCAGFSHIVIEVCF